MNLVNLYSKRIKQILCKRECQLVSNSTANSNLLLKVIYPKYYTLASGIDVGPTFINFDFFSRPYSLIKGPTFINFWNFYQALQKFSSLMGFFLYKFAHFVHGLRIFKALRLFFLTNFPGPTLILFDKFSRPYVYQHFFLKLHCPKNIRNI